MDTELKKTSARKGGYTAFVILSFCAVFALNILNSTALNMLLQTISTNVRYSSTILPHALYYFMSVLAIVWQFIGVAVIADAITRKKKALAAVSCVLFFAAMMASNMLPLIVAAIQYTSQTIFTLMQSNAEALLTTAIFGVVRILLIVGACLVVCAFARKKQKNRLSAALSACMWSAAVLALLSMLMIFIPNTLPFLQSAGQNALRSQLFKIIMEYVILAVYAVIGYAVASLAVRLADKKFK